MKRRYHRLLMLPAASLLATALFAGQALAGPKEDERATNAVRVLDEIRRMPEDSIPDKLLDEAKAIVVVPDSLKAGLVVGVTADLTARFSAVDLVRRGAEALGGKGGGGRPDMAQAGGPDGSKADDALKAIEAALGA